MTDVRETRWQTLRDAARDPRMRELCEQAPQRNVKLPPRFDFAPLKRIEEIKKEERERKRCKGYRVHDVTEAESTSPLDKVYTRRRG